MHAALNNMDMLSLFIILGAQKALGTLTRSELLKASRVTLASPPISLSLLLQNQRLVVFRENLQVLDYGTRS